MGRTAMYVAMVGALLLLGGQAWALERAGADEMAGVAGALPTLCPSTDSCNPSHNSLTPKDCGTNGCVATGHGKSKDMSGIDYYQQNGNNNVWVACALVEYYSDGNCTYKTTEEYVGYNGCYGRTTQ